MMENTERKLSLDRPVEYQIRVPGHLDESWSEWTGGMTVTVESDDDGLPVSTLVGTFDLAALQGLLNRLYSMGLPLISAICIEKK